ncbi:MAG: hypothetical protein ACOYK6_01090 [Chthoniobacterales bacterium]
MDDQKMHHLLQLKSYEHPTAEMLEEFISEFHCRQELHPSSSSFIEDLKRHLVFFFSDLQIPRMAYVGATFLALFCSLLIIQTNKSSQENNDPTITPLCSENFSAIHYYSSPIIQPSEEQPVSFDLNNKENDSILSSMSRLMQKKSSSKELLMSF